jgi:DNA adenine methylase
MMFKERIKQLKEDRQMIPNIERHIPRFSGRYIEPFFGGGALFFHLESKRAIINDINSKLI